MIGKYTFKQGGKVVAESENLITTAGRKALLDYVAGFTKRLGGAIAVGVGNTAANIADRKLNFEVARASVGVNTLDYANNAVVFRATLPANLAMTIYEAGLWTLDATTSAFGSQMLFDFNPNELWSGGTFVATNSRIDTALQLTAAVSSSTTYTLAGLALDLSGYSPSDQFTLVYRANNAFVSSVAVRFVTSAGNYYQTSVATPASGTYTITSVNKSAFTTTGTPDWANITELHIVVTSTAGGGASIDFDAIRVDDVDATNEEAVLFSRSVLGAPLVKLADLPMDVEYAVTL